MERFNSSEHTKYWDGKQNKAIRYYFYVQRGLALLNEFRYLLMAVFATYYALRIDNIWLIPVMLIISVPVLIVLGWLYVHKMAVVMDYLNIQFSTHFSKYSIHLQEELLKAIKEKK